MNLTAHFLSLKDMISRIEYTAVNVIVFWKDGSVSCATCSPDDTYDPEKGLAFAILNRLFGHNLWKDYIRKLMPSVPQYSLKDEVDILTQQNDTLQAASVYTSDKVKYLDMTTHSLKQDNEDLKRTLNTVLESYQELYNNFEELMKRYQEEHQSSDLHDTAAEKKEEETPQESEKGISFERIIDVLLNRLDNDDVIY